MGFALAIALLGLFFEILLTKFGYANIGFAIFIACFMLCGVCIGADIHSHSRIRKEFAVSIGFWIAGLVPMIGYSFNKWACLIGAPFIIIAILSMGVGINQTQENRKKVLAGSK
jgi:hypothetical protein